MLIHLQSCLALPVKAIAWLGSHGTRAVAALVFWLYFAMAQFPIYLAPQLLQPIARKLTARPVPTLSAEAAEGR